MRIIVYLLVFAIFPASLCVAQESMLTEISYPFLEKLIAEAKANQPKVKMYEMKVAIAGVAVKKAKRSYFDAFSFSYLYSPNNTITLVNPSLLNGYQMGLYVNLGTFVQKPLEVKLKRKELSYTELEKQQNDLELEATVKERYFVYIQQKSILKFKTQTLLDFETLLTSTRYKFEKGEETLINYNNVLMAYSDQLKNKIDAEAAFLIAKSHLEELLGKKLEEIK